MKHAITVHKDHFDNHFAIADMHMNHPHEGLLSGRGYKDVDEHNEGIIAKHNSVVPKNGVVFDLGDFCLHEGNTGITMKTLKRLNGSTRYIFWGNHNSGLATLYRQWVHEWFKQKGLHKCPDVEIYPFKKQIADKKFVIFVGDYLTVRVQGQDGLEPDDPAKISKIIMQHYAIRNWHHNAKGSWMLCGHSHGNDTGITMTGDQGRILDCGWESIKRPISFTELHSLMMSRTPRTNETHRKVVDHDSNS